MTTSIQCIQRPPLFKAAEMGTEMGQVCEELTHWDGMAVALA